MGRQVAGKRGNGEGTIGQNAAGRWIGRISLPDGRRKGFRGKTRQEVQRQMAAALHGLEQGLPVVNERQTVAQWLTSWLEMVQTTVKPRAHQRYEESMRLHVVPTLGKLPLAKLTAPHLQRLYAAKLTEGLSPTTVNNCIHTVIHHALEDAMRMSLVPRNVADLVTPPRPAKTEMRPFTPEEVQRLLRAAEGDRLEAFYTLMIHTGLRLGEALALHWADVDLDGAHPALSIKYTLYHPRGKRGEYILSEPKTAKSRRRIDLNHTTIEALRRHRVRQLEERLALGEAWIDGDFVFTRFDGEPLRGVHVLQRHFHPLLQRAGLPQRRLHDLRHTAATLLLLGNVPVKVVSELLGHSSVSITLDRYSHVLPSMGRDAASAMERMLAAK